MRYTQLGENTPGLGGPGATCHLLEVAGKSIVMDCGTRFGTGPEGEKISIGPNLAAIRGKKIDAGFLTHVHADHMGHFPVFTREHRDTPIFASWPTSVGVNIPLDDFLKIQERTARDAYYSGKELPTPLFTSADADRFVNAIRPVEIGWVKNFMDWPGWQVGFYSSGHTRGAMSIFIASPEGYFAIIGDCSAHNQPLVKGVLLPPDDFIKEFIDEAEQNGGLTIITEATNGARTLQDMVAQEAALVATCGATKERGGVVLLKSFAEGRSANNAMRIAPHFPVHVDGLARTWWNFYKSDDSCWAEGDEECSALMRNLEDQGRVILVEGEHSEQEKHRINLSLGMDKCVGGGFSPIVTPSATMEQGAAVFYGQRILPKRENLVVSTGYRFPGTPGEKIFKVLRGETVQLGDKHVPVSCEVEHFDFSAHDGGDMLALRCQLLRAKNVIMHHGDDVNLAGLEKRLRALPNCPNVYWDCPNVYWGRNGVNILV